MISDENLAGDQIKPVELVDWLSEGESRELQSGATRVVVRMIDRKGRRARISVVASQNAPLESDGEV